MTPESTVKVTFHRTYDIDVSQVCGKLEEEGYEDVQMTEELIKQKAEEITKSWMSDEMDLFSEDLKNFVSATVEIVD